MITFQNASTNQVTLYSDTGDLAYLGTGAVLIVPSGTWGIERGTVSNGIVVGESRDATVAIGTTNQWVIDTMNPPTAFAKGFGWMSVIMMGILMWRMWSVTLRGDA